MADKDLKQSDCACASFDKLEGASVTAYIASFLESEKSSDQPNRYRCRVCRRSWEKVAADREGGRASLVRLDSD
ncbi:MAG TPA: hypothetical protein VGJ55_00095 [Pyrinomonadaceae bacterium]|jgi:hypothetical protein